VSEEAQPTPKCIITWSDRRNLCTVVRDWLTDVVPESDILPAGDDAMIALTALTADQLRDALRDAIEPDEALIVVEFETWSGYGQGVDSRWLLARGH
jgi:hypothetical protein